MIIRALLASAIVLTAHAGGPGSGRHCTGKDPCPVCHDCSRCKHCTTGRGSCGTCRDQSGEAQRKRDAKRARTR